MVDNEETWVNYEVDEMEVQLDLADMVLEELVVEAVSSLATIEQQRKSHSH